MVWKQDLAKLKQQFKEDEVPKPVKAPVPKPVPRLDPPGSIEDEDALFLNAMGRKRSAPVSRMEKIAPEPAPAAAPVEPPAEDFQTAMGDLKGLKPMPSRIPAEAPRAPESIPTPAPEAVAPPPPPPPPAEPLAAAAPVGGPALIHLAAGMAIEVDGGLDLRGHTTVDALERFRERLQDGVFLGWRTFHVTLGPSEELRAAFLALLLKPEAQVITRYAQAPIPMGGTHAWILYYAGPGAH